MKRADWIFIVVVVAVVMFFVGLSTFSDKPPNQPNDPEHRTATSRAQCLACHSPDNQASVKPITPKHPSSWKDERFKCTNCHQLVASR
jgi:hypothetical protein